MLFSCPVQNFKMIKWLSNFSTSLDYTLAIEYDVYIWQVSPRVSCGDTCQIWLCFKDQKATFARSNTLLTEKLKSEALTLNVRGQVISVKLGQYHGCWCPGSLRRQDSSSNDIDYVEYVGPGLIWGRILSTCVISMWSNGMNCKYLALSLQNLALKRVNNLYPCSLPVEAAALLTEQNATVRLNVQMVDADRMRIWCWNKIINFSWRTPNTYIAMGCIFEVPVSTTYCTARFNKLLYLSGTCRRSFLKVTLYAVLV